MVKNIFRIAACLVLFAIATSCSHAPRSNKDSEAIKQIRMEYIKSYPEGQYNENIMKGEVVKGMGFMSVLASWGLPNVRRVSEGNIYEYWTYYTEDKPAGMWTMYELRFKDQMLASWVIDKNIAGEGGIRPDYNKPPVSIGQGDIQGSDDTPIRKK